MLCYQTKYLLTFKDMRIKISGIQQQNICDNWSLFLVLLNMHYQSLFFDVSIHYLLAKVNCKKSMKIFWNSGGLKYKRYILAEKGSGTQNLSASVHKWDLIFVVFKKVDKTIQYKKFNSPLQSASVLHLRK